VAVFCNRVERRIGLCGVAAKYLAFCFLVSIGRAAALLLPKRFTRWSHLVLGFALGIAPRAAWIAIRGSLDLRILLLTAAISDVCNAGREVDVVWRMPCCVVIRIRRGPWFYSRLECGIVCLVRW